MIEFTVLGTPQPQGSKTRTRFGMREDNRDLAPWREAILWALKRAMREADRHAPMLAPLEIEADFYFCRPRSHYGTGRNAAILKPSAPGKYHAQKPDLDKLLRALGDALTIGGAIRDDSQIAITAAHKYWADSAYMTVLVEELP